MTEYARKLLGQIEIAEMLWARQPRQRALLSAQLTWSQWRCLGGLVSRQTGPGSPTLLARQGQQSVGSPWAAKSPWTPKASTEASQLPLFSHLEGRLWGLGVVPRPVLLPGTSTVTLPPRSLGWKCNTVSLGFLALPALGTLTRWWHRSLSVRSCGTE